VRDIDPQYRIIPAGAGWAPKSARGRLRFTGRDRVSFLQALLTNEIAALEPNAGTYALYLTPQGRIIADLHVFVRPDSVLADVPVEISADLASTFDRLIFSEDVHAADASAGIAQLSVMGANAAAALSASLGLDEASVRSLPLWSQLDIPGGFVARTDDADAGSWDVLIAAASAGDLLAALGRTGAAEISEDVVETLRIEAARPRMGVDMTVETIPLEAGLLDRAISQTKGCYVGQEVIIRILHRGAGRVARRLVQIQFDAGLAEVPPAGAVLSAGDAATGHITSACWSPKFGRPVALGYVHRDHAEAGREVIASWVQGSGFSVQGSGFIVPGSGFEVPGSGFEVH